MPYPIIIPLHHGGGKLHNNTELRYALRSLCANLGDFQLAIVSKAVPSWLEGAEHIKSEKGLKKALRDTAKRFPDGFIWWYDDLTLLSPVTIEDLKQTPCSKGILQGGETGWAKGLETIRAKLVAEGYTPRDYSRPHGPYFFDQEMVEEGFADWPGMAGKFPWESWILSKRNWPQYHGGYKQYYGAFSEPRAGLRYLNYNDDGNTPELRSWLSNRFPDPCRFEGKMVDYFFIHIPKNGGKSLLAAVPGRLAVESLLRHKEWADPVTQTAWRSAGSPPILAVVRHPVDRAISTYHYFRTRKDFTIADAAHIVLGEMCRHMTLSEFWEKVDIPTLAAVVKHLRTQHSFIKDAPDPRVLRFENLTAEYTSAFGVDAPPLPHLNASTREGDAVLSAAAEARVRKIYANDFKHYYPGG